VSPIERRRGRYLGRCSSASYLAGERSTSPPSTAGASHDVAPRRSLSAARCLPGPPTTVRDSMELCLMVEGQEGVTWTEWVALARTCEAHGIPKLFRSDHYLNLAGVTER